MKNKFVIGGVVAAETTVMLVTAEGCRRNILVFFL